MNRGVPHRTIYSAKPPFTKIQEGFMPHDHDHHHDHHSHHHHDEPSPLTLKEQLATLIAHWVDHNESHKGNYLVWAERAREGGYTEAADLIQEIAGITDSVTDKLKQAQEKVHTAP